MRKYLTVDNASRVLLIWLLISIGTGIGSFFQTEHQVVSPLIPKSIVIEISRPYLFAGLICTGISLVALLFYFFGKFRVVILICCIAIVWRFYYINWGAW
jgi:hypothetical protein